MDSRYMEIAALGRPLYPGMLYDCRKDTFIPGVTLWDKKALRDDLDVHKQPKTHLKFASSDTLSDKANLLDISASLKASFLSGLVEVGGSAKYLRDNKSSARQCRVTMQYSQTTKFEQLTMKELGNITYPQVFDQKTATHVVTAVLYGAQAFMVFDYTSEENESKQAVEGHLHAVVKKIPTITIEGEASLQMTEEEKKLAENISVTFYGDFEIEENPTTYKEALEVYKKLPSLMKQQQQKGVPLNVWLYPLTLLNDKAAKLVREISMSLVCKAEHLLEELGEVERRCNDLIKNQMTHNFPDLNDRLSKFQALQKNYMRSFQKALFRVLPAIRGGIQEDKALVDILNINYKSPFTASNMNKWLDDVTTELNILSSYTSGLKDLTVVKSPASLSSIFLDPDVDIVVCLSFTSLKYEDSYLTALQDFENIEGFTVLGQSGERDFSLQATQPWFTSSDISESMRQNLYLFASFSKANKNDKRMKFIIVSIPDACNPGTSIRLYQKGRLIDSRFQPVSKPPLPVVETSDERVIVKVSKSPTGKTVQFRVEYRMTESTDSAADADEWSVQDTLDAQTSFTLTGLKPGKQYLVRYKALSDVGVSEASETVSFTFHGEKSWLQKKSISDVGITSRSDVGICEAMTFNAKVGQSWNITSSLFNEVRTKIMTSMGMSRWSLSTIKSEISNVVNSPSIPYIDTIPGGLRAEMALYFQGIATGQQFSFNLITGLTANDDIAFHFNPRINDFVVQNSRRNGRWENEERTSGCPISSGSAFDIFIVTNSEGYVVYVNGQWNCLFKHRMPMEKVAKLYIYGDVILNMVGIVGNWSESTFDKELVLGMSRTKLSDIQFDIPQPICNPRKQYMGPIPGGLRPGMALFLQGVVPSDCERFEINFQTGPKYLHDIAFHFNPRMYAVICNTCRNGTWDENYIENRGGPFVKGGAFDIIMVIKPECYEVMVNGLEYYKFNHRIPVEKVATLDIRGDVFMKILRFIEVDGVNLKVSMPANI